MTTYTPTPGSIAHRAIEHLQSIDGYVAVSTLELSKRLGVSVRRLPGALNPAYDAGFLFREHRPKKPNGRMFWWALSPDAFTSLQPEPEPDEESTEDDEADTMPIVRRCIKAGSVPPPVTRAARSVFEVAA